MIETLQNEILNFQKKTHSDFNIFNYISEDLFLQLEPDHQKALDDFIKTAIQLRKFTFYTRCLICSRHTKNFICRSCVMDMKL